MKKIPLVRPLIPALHEIKPLLRKSRKANQWSNFGPCFDEAVEILHKRTGRHMLPVCNGTAAIQVACISHLKKGDRVVMPDFTHIGTYCAVRDAGMFPIFCKTDEENWAIDLQSLIENRNTFDAFVVVAPFGYYVDVTRYELFALANNKKIIYDYAGAWGQFPYTRHPVCYSLHATKGWSTGEGGLVSYYTKEEFERGRRITNFNIGPDGTIPEDIGSNFKMEEHKCAMITAHMKNSARILSKTEKRSRSDCMYENREKFIYAFIEEKTNSLCILPNMGHIDPLKIKNFVCKFYYPLLTRMPHLKHVKRFSESSDYFTKCLALPTDVSDKELEIICKELDEYGG